MPIFQVLAIAIALLHIGADAFFTPLKYNSTEDWSVKRHIYSTPPLVVTSSDGRLIHILDANDTSNAIEIFSTNSKKPCKIPLELTYSMRYPRRATSLGNGKLIIWLHNYNMTLYKHIGEWRFAVIDPKTCNAAGLKLKIDDIDPYPVDIIDVVGYENTFDILMTKSLSDEESKYIYAYRYDEHGNPVSSVMNSVIPDSESYPFYRPNTIKVHPVKKHDSSDGYFFIQVKPESKMTIVKHLESNFSTKRIVHLTHTDHKNFLNIRFDAYSTDQSNFTACRYTLLKKNHLLQCQLLNSSLNPIANVSLAYHYYFTSTSKIMHMSVNNLAGGGAFLVFNMKVERQAGVPIYIQRISETGAASEPQIFGRVSCEINSIDSFHMKDREYCVTVTCDELVYTRCIDVEYEKVHS